VPGVTSTPSPRPSAATTAAARDATAFLTTALLPAVVKARNPSLERAVRRAAATGELGRLAQLPERQRRELLDTLERKSPRTPRPETARAVVYLTTTLAASLPSDAGVVRRLASPAR